MLPNQCGGEFGARAQLGPELTWAAGRRHRRRPVPAAVASHAADGGSGFCAEPSFHPRATQGLQMGPEEAVW